MIHQFISEVKTRGLARTNRFVVEFGLPRVAFSDNATRYTAQLFCDAVQLPGMNISSQQSRIHGEERQIPYERTFDNMVLNFYVDADLKVKDLFDQWIQAIINPTTRALSYYDDYTTNVTIKVADVQQISVSVVDGQLIDAQDLIPYEVTLYECWPKMIAPVQMDATDHNVMKLQVTLQYKYWRATAHNVTRRYVSVPGLTRNGQSNPNRADALFTGPDQLDDTTDSGNWSSHIA